MLLVLLLGGVVGDRFARVRVMVASDLVRGVLVCGLAVLALAHRLVLWHVYGASLLFGFVDAFFEPAYRAVLPQLAPATALPSANALTSLSTQLGCIVGPALGAALVATGGTAAAFARDGLSFFVSAAYLVPLVGMPAPERGAGGAASVLRDVRDALGTVGSSPWLRKDPYCLLRPILGDDENRHPGSRLDNRTTQSSACSWSSSCCSATPSITTGR
jgi:DHA3 family tetracycline resistance protein-like MFS transporter